MLRIIIFLTLLVGSTFANAALHVLFLNGISGDVEKSTNAVIAIRSIINESGLSDRFGGVQYGRIFNPNDGFTEDNIELDLQAFLSTWAIEDAKRLDPSAKMGGSLYKAFLGKTYYDGITNGVRIFDNYPEARARVFSVVKNAARQIDVLLNSGHQVIVISHSQGNFHAEAVDAYLRYGKSSAESVLYDTNMRFVGAASVAASTPNGRYVSITEDIALKLHRVRRTNIDYDILPPTITMCLSGGFCAFNESALLAIDATIHGFVEIYTAIPLYGTELLTGNVVAPFRVLANLIEASRSELQGGGVFLGSNGHRYQTITCGTWSQCRDAAVAKGGQLVTIRSQAENDWLVANFPMTEHYWIGATNDGIVGAWRWVSNEPFRYRNLGSNLNNVGGNENCAHFYSVTPGFWNDLRCDSQDVKKAIVEYINSDTITVLANTIPGATLIVPTGASTCTFNSTGTWSAGPQAPPQYQNADGVIGGTSYNLIGFGVPMPGEGNMALVVKHSASGNWNLLGSSKTISVVAGETLSFMMNDATTFGYTDGNTGQLSTVWSCN